MLVLALLLFRAAGVFPSEQVDFHAHIKPLLSDRCYACHGPDATARKAGLRLDLKEGLFKSRKGRPPIVKPGDPTGSELFLRITATDPAERMPPEEKKLALSRDEIELFRRWIAQGAEVPDRSHWSFQPVAVVPVPRASGAARNPIDAFVHDRLRRVGLRPAPEASRATLLRRLALDLTGLPPTLAELDAVMADTSLDWYERVVERYLASPHYGERLANDWLDLARYADTYGYQADMDRDMSPWRDWVIRAFNANLPYDQFILWQLAGDLLPNPTREQYLATAFNRLHRQTNEGGSIEEEFRTEYVADRVHTFGTAFLGLTLECARCHDHKYDPINQKDYYRLFAFFNSIDESGLYSHFTQATPTPTLLLYEKDAENRHRDLKHRIAAAETHLAELRLAARSRFERWLAEGKRSVPAPQPVASFAFESVDNEVTPNGVEARKPGRLVDGPVLADGRLGKGLQFSGDNALVLKDIGEFKRTDPFSIGLWVKPTEKLDRSVILHRSRAWTDSGSRGYELLLENGRPSFALIHFYPGNAIHVRGRQVMPLNAWSHVCVTYDGSSRAAGLRLYLDGEPLAVEVVRDNLYRDIVHRQEWGDAEADNIELTLAGRFRDSGFKNGVLDELQVFDRCLTPAEVRHVAGRPVTAGSEELFDYYLESHDPDYQRGRAELRRLRDEENDLVNGVREIMVMRDLPRPRPTFILKRGLYNSPGEQVEPGTPDAILPLPPQYPRNRLGLARWLIDRRNPLTARVVVNRIWRLHFGRGLVATQEDFGSQGQLPSHPDLLDWLAGWFMDNGWDLKALHRLIVTSATYRQTSQADPALTVSDPDNRLLARGPKHRLTAEQIRDSALSVSGLLVRKLGGPSVKPYQPAGLWEESGTGKTYVQDKGEKLYRRSLYTFWRRTAPPPAMLTFDATPREVCTAKRESTATPLQALVLLNDPQFVEAARVLGERLVRETKEAEIRVAQAFRLGTGRWPLTRERDILRKLYDEQLTYFAAHPEAAEQYLTIGDWPRDRSLPAAEVAACAVLASTVLSHDEFVTKR